MLQFEEKKTRYFEISWHNIDAPYSVVEQPLV